MAASGSSPISIYTDGSCLGNGMANARAGIGVFFGVDHPRNISRSLDDPKKTNNRAEVRAILAAVEELTPELERGERVIIHTDSEYSIRVCSNVEYNKRMMASGWTERGQPVPNAELIREAWERCRVYPNLEFVHVYGHSAEEGPDSFGNNWADRLARAGAGSRLRLMRPPNEAAPRRTQTAPAATASGSYPVSRTGSRERRRSPLSKSSAGPMVWLQVPFAEKDEAKELGAWWNPQAKKWYVPTHVTGKNRAELTKRWG